MVNEASWLRAHVEHLETEKEELKARVNSAEKILGGCEDRMLKEEIRIHFDKYPAALTEQE